MFIEMFFELLALLGSIIVGGIIVVVCVFVLFLVILFLKNFVKIIKDDSKPEDK